MSTGKTTHQKLSLDELLRQQQERERLFLATIEEIAGDAEHVKITQWTKADGCGCERSVTIPRSSIDHVVPTNEKHLCCGKTLQVVEVYFKEGASLPLLQVFAQMARKSKPHHDHGHGVKAKDTICMCDHFVRRYCAADGWMYEDYLCYDETGAACGSQTVPLGMRCTATDHAKGSRSSMRPEMPQPITTSSPGMQSEGCPSGWATCGPLGCYNTQTQCCCLDRWGNYQIKDNSLHQSCYYICGGA